MRIYFSGGHGRLTPEYLMPERKPHVMLTFLEVVGDSRAGGKAYDRLRHHVMRKKGKDPSLKLNNSKPRPVFRRKPKKLNQEKIGIIY